MGIVPNTLPGAVSESSAPGGGLTGDPRRRQPRQPEVEPLDAGLRQHDVGRLQVATDDPHRVRRAKRVENLDRYFDRAPGVQRALSPAAPPASRRRAVPSRGTVPHGRRFRPPRFNTSSWLRNLRMEQLVAGTEPRWRISWRSYGRPISRTVSGRVDVALGRTDMTIRRNGYFSLALLLFISRLWAQAPSGEDVLKARESALAAGDAVAVLKLFADDAIVVTSSGRLLIGKEQVTVWVKDQTDRGQREEAGTRQVQGNKLTWAGKVHRNDWKKLGVSPLGVRQDAIIEGGKIRFFNTTFDPESAERLEASRKKQ
jgi:hypothetical protein